jgi:hypothetical protein
MSEIYVVKQGDFLAKVAASAGVSAPATIWTRADYADGGVRTEWRNTP